jgi:hypothetical protein
MRRIFIDSDAGTSDLAERFVQALGLLQSEGIKPRPGTKLISKYARCGVSQAHLPQVKHRLHLADPDFVCGINSRAVSHRSA